LAGHLGRAGPGRHRGRVGPGRHRRRVGPCAAGRRGPLAAGCRVDAERVVAAATSRGSPTRTYVRAAWAWCRRRR
jgi:hypothetical protein